jgi:hypothetical protein
MQLLMHRHRQYAAMRSMQIILNVCSCDQLPVKFLCVCVEPWCDTVLKYVYS